MATNELYMNGTLGHRAPPLMRYEGKYFDEYTKEELWAKLLTHKYRTRSIFFDPEQKHARRLQHMADERRYRWLCATLVALGLPVAIAMLAGAWRLAVMAVLG